MKTAKNSDQILDVRSVPFWRRLPLITTTVNQLQAGEALELVVDLDPWPLKLNFDATRQAKLDWDYLESGPVVWRVRLSRRA